MKGRIILGLAGVATFGALAVGAALGTESSGLSGSLIARGASGELTLRDKSQKLKLQAKDAMDVALVQATLAPDGYTGWHGHAAPSLVIVKTGTIEVSEVHGRTCAVERYGAGQAFVHSEDAHNFVAVGGAAEIYIVYLLPQGASPAPIDVPAVPAACSS